MLDIFGEKNEMMGFENNMFVDICDIWIVFFFRKKQTSVLQLASTRVEAIKLVAKTKLFDGLLLKNQKVCDRFENYFAQFQLEIQMPLHKSFEIHQTDSNNSLISSY